MFTLYAETINHSFLLTAIATRDCSTTEASCPSLTNHLLLCAWVGVEWEYVPVSPSGQLSSCGERGHSCVSISMHSSLYFCFSVLCCFFIPCHPSQDKTLSHADPGDYVSTQSSLGWLYKWRLWTAHKQVCINFLHSALVCESTVTISFDGRLSYGIVRQQ